MNFTYSNMNTMKYRRDLSPNIKYKQYICGFVDTNLPL